MNKEEILKKAIEQAESNGYKFWNINPNLVTLSQDGERWFYKKSPYNYYASVHATIFSHSFAKAFWGSENECWNIDEDPRTQQCQPAWQYHLQQMVLEENPLDYLAKFLKGK